MRRTYSYVGPDEVRRRVAEHGPGAPIRVAEDLASILRARDSNDMDEPMTFVIDANGILRVANRRSEHVACAGGGEVLSAGELTAVVRRSASGGGGGGGGGADDDERTSLFVVVVVDISNQSTGYCPEPESWPAVAQALDRAGIEHPGHFTYEAIFRRCVKCGQRNLVKEGWFECGLCNAELPAHWNFGDSNSTAPKAP